MQASSCSPTSGESSACGDAGMGDDDGAGDSDGDAEDGEADGDGDTPAACHAAISDFQGRTLLWELRSGSDMRSYSPTLVIAWICRLSGVDASAAAQLH